LVIDYGLLGALHVFCAVLAWSRVRFVRFAGDEKATTTLRLLAECFEFLGGVPRTVLADRMGYVKAGWWRTWWSRRQTMCGSPRTTGFRPDFCEPADPESKGIVEALVGYANVT
jgi:transposase